MVLYDSLPEALLDVNDPSTPTQNCGRGLKVKPIDIARSAQNLK